MLEIAAMMAITQRAENLSSCDINFPVVASVNTAPIRYECLVSEEQHSETGHGPHCTEVKIYRPQFFHLLSIKPWFGIVRAIFGTC